MRRRRIRPRRILRMALLAFGSALFLATVLLTAAVLTLQTEWAKDALRNRLETELSSLFVGDVRIASLGGNIVQTLVIQDMEIEDASGAPALAIGELRVDYNLLALFKKQISVRRIGVSDLRVSATRNAEGAINLANLLRPKDTETSFDWRMVVDAVSITGSAEIFGRSLPRFAVRASHLVVDHGDFSGRDLSVRAQDSSIILPAVSWHQQSQTPHLRGRATITPALLDLALDKPVISQAIEAEFSAHRPQEDEPIEIRVNARSGTQRVDAAVKLDVAKRIASGKLDLEHLHLRPVAEDTDLSMTLRFTLRGFSLDSAEASIDMQAAGKVYGQDLEAVRVQSELHDGLLSTSAELHVPGAEAHAESQVRIDQDPVFILSSRLSAESDDLGMALGRWIEVAGAMKLMASAHGPATAPEFDVALNSPGLRLQGQPLGPVQATVTATRQDDVLRVNTQDALLGPVRVTGQAKISSALLRTEITDLRVDLSKLPAGIAGDSPPGGILRLRGSVQRAGAHWTADLSYELQRLTLLAGLAPVSGRGRLRLDDGTLRAQLRAWGPNQQALQLRARAQIPGDLTNMPAWSALDASALGRLDLSYENIDLARIARALDFDGLQAGLSHGELTLRGDRDVELRVELLGVSAEDFLMHDVQATLDLRLRRNTLRVDGHADLGELGKVSAEVEAAPPSKLFALEQWKRRGLSRVRRLELQLRDSLISRQHLSRLGISWPFESEQVGRIEAQLAIEAGERARFTMEAKQLRTRLWEGEGEASVEVAIDDGTATIGGTFNASDSLDLQLDAESQVPGDLLDPRAWQDLSREWLRSARLRARATRTGSLLTRLGVPLDIEGSTELTLNVEDHAEQASLQGRFQGRLSPKDPHVALVTTDLRIDPNEMHLAADLSDDSEANAQVNATLSAGSQQFWRAGLAPLMSAPIAAKLTLQKLQLARVAGALQREERPSAVICALASATGTLNNPSIAVKIQSSAIQYQGARFPGLFASGRFTREKSELRMRSRKGGTGTAEALRAHATLATPPGQPARVNAKLVVNDFMLRPFAEFVPDLAGSASGEIVATGSLPYPEIEGHMVVEELSLRTLGPLRDLRKGHLVARSRGSQAQIRLTAQSGKGELSLESDIELSRDVGLRGLQAEWRSRDLPIQTESTRLFLTSKGKLRGKRNEEGALIAHIDVGDSVAVLPKQTGAPELHPIGDLEDVVIVTEEAPAPTKRSRSFLPRVIAYVNAPNTLLVRAPEGRATVSVNLTLKTGDELSVTGSAQSQEGILELFGSRYRIRRAWAHFHGDAKDPQLDVRLVREFSTFTLGIEVSGSAKEPKLRLTSDPPIYDEAQLLSFVLGADPDEPATDERTMSERASGLAAGLLAGQVQSLVKDRLPIDVLRVELGDDATELTRLTLGKWITQKLFVAYRHRFEAKPEENTEEAVIEYRFMRRWLLEGYFGDRAAAGADLLWIRRF